MNFYVILVNNNIYTIIEKYKRGGGGGVLVRLDRHFVGKQNFSQFSEINKIIKTFICKKYT